MNKDGLKTLEFYKSYITANMPTSWRAVCTVYNVREQFVNIVTEYCYEHQLKEAELYQHIHENELICAADFSKTSQGVDWWITLSEEASEMEKRLEGFLLKEGYDEKNSNS